MESRMSVPNYASKALNLHNAYRAQHNSPPLVWSSELQVAATRHAILLASRKGSDRLVPKSNVKWGQNVFELTSRNVQVSEEVAVDRAVKSWYNGISDYNWKDQSSLVPGTKSGLNFSQMIWASARLLGIGVASNKTGNLIVVVGFYDPAGNYQGEFQSNVFPKLKSLSVNQSPANSTPYSARFPTSQGSTPNGRSSRSRSRDPSVPQWLSEGVEIHNKYRKKHGSSPLQLDQKLCDQAQDLASALVDGKDPQTLGKGRNIYRVYGSLDPLDAIRKAVPKWYSQSVEYNWSAPLLSGHQANLFCQLLWRSSKAVGFGVATSQDDLSPLTVVVACYSPPGNVAAEKSYRENVRPALY